MKPNLKFWWQLFWFIPIKFKAQSFIIKGCAFSIFAQKSVFIRYNEHLDRPSWTVSTWSEYSQIADKTQAVREIVQEKLSGLIVDYRCFLNQKTVPPITKQPSTATTIQIRTCLFDAEAVLASFSEAVDCESTASEFTIDEPEWSWLCDSAEGLSGELI